MGIEITSRRTTGREGLYGITWLPTGLGPGLGSSWEKQVVPKKLVYSSIGRECNKWDTVCIEGDKLSGENELKFGEYKLKNRWCQIEMFMVAYVASAIINRIQHACGR
jgi:hypothetical protein